MKVYQKALAFTKLVRKATKGFPKDEMFVLNAQFKRAADSIVLNIAEGAGNPSKKEFSRFLDYSIRSAFECIGGADIVHENEFFSASSYTDIIKNANEIIAMLYGLQKSLHRSL